MSSGNRGPKDPKFGGTRQPSTPGTDPEQSVSDLKRPAMGPSTQTVPPGTPGPAARRPRRARASADAAPRARPEDREAMQDAEDGDAVAEDAWADYEEDTNDWLATDEHSIAGPKAALAPKAPVTATASRADAVQAAIPGVPQAFDPAEHAVPRGPSYDPALDMGSFEGLGGEDATKRWPITATMLTQGRVRLGRGVDNDVVLGDPSISRAHAELRRSGDAWEVIDLGSGNGTFVGGVRVTVNAPLPAGATLGLGSGTYRLALPGMQMQSTAAASTAASGNAAGHPHAAAPRPAFETADRGTRGLAPPAADAAPAPKMWVLPRAVTQSPPWLRYTMLGISVALMSGAAMGTWHMLRVWDIVGPLHTAMFEHYLDGVQALNAHHWDEAEAAFSAVMEADPQSIRGKRYLAEAQAGRKDEAMLQAAQTALGQKDWQKAYKLAKSLQEGLFHGPSRVICQQIQNHVDGRVVEAQAALEAGQIKEAQALLAEAQSIMPDRPDVALMRTRANSTLGLAYGSTPPPTGPVMRVYKSRSPKRRVATVGRRDAALAAPIADFNAGNPDDALTKLDAMDAASAQAMAQSVRAFVKAYNTGLAEHRNKRAFAAVQALTQAKTLEARVGGGAGKLAGLIDVKLADMYYVMGMEAYAAGHLGEAAEAWRQALGAVPEHALSKAKLDELSQKAEVLIDEAQSLSGQDTEKAKSLLRDALQMLPAQSPSRVRAQKLAQSLP